MEKELSAYLKKESGIPNDISKKYDYKLADPEPEKGLKAYIEKLKGIMK